MIVVAPGVVLGTARPRSGGFPRHSHDEYVISANLCGREDVRLDRASFEVGTREVTVYNPGQVQSCTTVAAPGAVWGCLSLYVSAPVAAAWSGGSPPEARRPVLVDPALRSDLLRAGTLARSAEADPGARRALAELLEVLFRQVVTAAGARLPGPGGPSGRGGALLAAQVRERLLDDLEQPVDLGDLAREAGCSREHLIRCFSERYGCPPYAYQLGARLARARSHLAAGMPVARAAHAVGFADQAHLSKHFAAAYATSPGRWRTAHLEQLSALAGAGWVS